jgi:predicted N-acetyltransferase YhbS
MFTINDINSADLPHLARLYEQLSGRQIDPNTMQGTFEKIRDNDDYYLIGARVDNNLLVGTVMAVICHDLVKESRPFLIMENFVVDSGWHRRGVGSMLIGRVEAIATERNCIFVQFCSSSFRTGAHAFYEESGYNPGEVKGFRKYF